MKSPGSILIIRPSALGDVCRTVPVLASLKSAFPNARIDWVVQDAFIDAVVAHPALHRAIPFPRRSLDLSKVARPSWWRTFRAFVADLREPGYDVVIDAQGLSRSAIFARLTGAPLRIGDRQAGELAWIGANHRVETTPGMHTVDRMLALLDSDALHGVEAIRDMRLYAPSGADAVFDRHPGLKNARFIVVAPTTRWPGKLWPDDRHAAVARQLLDSGLADIVAIVGAESERVQIPHLLEVASTDDRMIDLVGGTSIGELMTLIERSALVIAGDSAAIHMAVGFDRPMVALFGPTRIDRVGPYQRDADVIQYCDADHTLSHKDEAAGRAAMALIPTDAVVDAARARLADEPAQVARMADA